MSIYLEFPAIEDYPLYSDPFQNDEQIFHGDEEIVYDDIQTLKDYLMLKMI